MSAPPIPRLRAVDPNLLTVLDVLLAERSVTRAAERLGMTQPAVSNALSRLRLLFDDELFVRSSKEMATASPAFVGSFWILECLDFIDMGHAVCFSYPHRVVGTHDASVALIEAGNRCGRRAGQQESATT